MSLMRKTHWGRSEFSLISNHLCLNTVSRFHRMFVTSRRCAELFSHRLARRRGLRKSTAGRKGNAEGYGSLYYADARTGPVMGSSFPLTFSVIELTKEKRQHA